MSFLPKRISFQKKRHNQRPFLFFFYKKEKQGKQKKTMKDNLLRLSVEKALVELLMNAWQKRKRESKKIVIFFSTRRRKRLAWRSQRKKVIFLASWFDESILLRRRRLSLFWIQIQSRRDRISSILSIFFASSRLYLVCGTIGNQIYSGIFFTVNLKNIRIRVP